MSDSVIKKENLKVDPAKGEFAKDVLKMASAPLCTQILGVILMPVITRLYIPDIYGTFQLYVSIVMPVAVFVCLGYNSSIVLPQKDEVAANMLIVSLISTVTITLLTTLLLIFGSQYLLSWLKSPELGRYIWIIPVNVFAHGLYLTLRSWNVRNRGFSRIATARIIDSAMNKGVLIGTGLSGLATSGSLIAGRLAGSFSMSGILGARVWKEHKELFKSSIRWRKILEGIKRYRKFPMYNLWTELLARIATTVIVFFFSFYFTKKAIGYYSLCVVILSLPMTFIAGSIGEVFYQRGARARHDGTNSELAEKLFSLMVKLGMFAFFLLAASGDRFFGFVFGSEWAEAGIFAQILIFKIFINFIMTPARILTNILEKQEATLILNISVIVLSSISLVIGGKANNVYIALGLFSLLNGLAGLSFGLYIFRHAGIALSKIFKILLKCFLSCLPLISVILLLKLYFEMSSLSLIIASAVSCAIYYGILLKKDKVIQSAISSIFSRSN